MDVIRTQSIPEESLARPCFPLQESWAVSYDPDARSSDATNSEARERWRCNQVSATEDADTLRRRHWKASRTGHWNTNKKDRESRKGKILAVYI